MSAASNFSLPNQQQLRPRQNGSVRLVKSASASILEEASGQVTSPVEPTPGVIESSADQPEENRREDDMSHLQEPSLPTGALLQSLLKIGDPALEEECIGISRPLYLLIDTMFELQSHGFIWRQVLPYGSCIHNENPLLRLC